MSKNIVAQVRPIYSGKISKLSKGRYSRSDETSFGLFQPKQNQVVRDLLKVFDRTDFNGRCSGDIKRLKFVFPMDETGGKALEKLGKKASVPRGFKNDI